MLNVHGVFEACPQQLCQITAAAQHGRRRALWILGNYTKYKHGRLCEEGDVCSPVTGVLANLGGASLFRSFNFQHQPGLLTIINLTRSIRISHHAAKPHVPPTPPHLTMQVI